MTALLPAGFPYLRSLNFGARALVDPIDPLEVERRLARYDPIGAAEVRDRIRATAGLDAAADDLIALYERVLDEERELPPPDLAAELRAVSRYLRWGPLRGTRWWAE
jgi:hypothetical protein